jgi:L-fucose isomerase-like protein
MAEARDSIGNLLGRAEIKDNLHLMLHVFRKGDPSMSIGLCSLISPLHKKEVIDETDRKYLEHLGSSLGEVLVESSPESSKDHDMTIIHVRSGGVEGRFKEIFRSLKEPYLLLAGDLHNSLPASLEILTFVQKQGLRGEILHGDAPSVAERLRVLLKVARALKRMKGTRLGLLGEPSDWLIASAVEPKEVRKKLGIELVPVSMEEFIAEIGNHEAGAISIKEALYHSGFDAAEIDKALLNFAALCSIVSKYELQGLTVRCFDLLGNAASTGCLALSLLNSEGIIAGCEGDVPSLLSMVILNYLTGEPVFMANPSRLNVNENTVLLAHCTVPLSMVEGWSLDTHFESGIGLALCGSLGRGRGTLFKISSDLSRYFVSPLDMVEHRAESHLCRTQVMARLESDVSYFVQKPLGNHHLLCKGDHAAVIREAMDLWGMGAIVPYSHS